MKQQLTELRVWQKVNQRSFSDFFVQKQFYLYLQDLDNALANNAHKEQAEALVLLTRNLITEIMKDTSCATKKQAVADYGKAVRDQFIQHENEFAAELEIIDKLLYMSIQLELYSLDLLELDQEISRVTNLQPSADRVLHHGQFISSLHQLRNDFYNDLNKQRKDDQCWAWQSKTVYSTRNEVLQSDTCALMKSTTAMLKSQQFTPESQHSDLQNFVKYKNENNLQPQNQDHAKLFFKGAWAVVTTGIGFILGSTVGLIAGAVVGAVALLGISPEITIAALGIGLWYGAQYGAKLGRDVGKWSVGMKPTDSIGQHLFFQPAPKEQAHAMTEIGKALISPSQQEKVRHTHYGTAMLA